MNLFADLFSELSEPLSPDKRQDLVVHFFKNSSPDEKMKGLFLLLGGKIKRPVSTRKLKTAISQSTGISDWLLNESLKSSGNLAETLTLLFDDPANSNQVSLNSIFQLVESCRKLTDDVLPGFLFGELRCFNRSQRLLSFQLLCGSFKPGFKPGQLFDLFAKATGLPSASLLHHLTDKWHPDSVSFDELKTLIEPHLPLSYPVFIPPLRIQRELSGLQNPTGWLAEWKASGREVQLVKQAEKVILFDEEGSPVLNKYLDLLKAGQFLHDGTILTGTIVSSELPAGSGFSDRNIAGKRVAKFQSKEKFLTVLIGKDILVYQYRSLLEDPFQSRRVLLENCLKEFKSDHFFLPETIEFTNWKNLTHLLENPIPMGIDGILLRDTNQVELSGILLIPRPQTIKAVLIYVQVTSDSRQISEIDLTLAVWHQEALVSIAKISHSFFEEESRHITKFVKENTIERFGPVRTVKPELVFEIEFDSVEPSGRHKSGLVLKNPKILSRIAGVDKNEAGKLSDLKKMVKKSLRTRDTEA